LCLSTLKMFQKKLLMTVESILRMNSAGIPSLVSQDTSASRQLRSVYYTCTTRNQIRAPDHPCSACHSQPCVDFSRKHVNTALGHSSMSQLSQVYARRAEGSSAICRKRDTALCSQNMSVFRYSSDRHYPVQLKIWKWIECLKSTQV
jgi:hypothetical protein